jgi:ComF family protein
MTSVAATFRAIGRTALDAVLPARCLACAAVVGAAGGVCGDCWGQLAFLAAPLCRRCGYPFEHDLGAEAVCAACVAFAPAYDRARAALRYDEASRGLILQFKHADRTDAARAFGRWLARAGGELLTQAQVIVPVPLHWTRLFQRRYNQSALLALALAYETGLPAATLALVRRRRTPSQGHLSPTARWRNVASAFAVPARRRSELAGRRVLLVDDVLTTGATVEACAKTLLAAGAAGVDVLTLARVVRPQAG